MKLMSNRSLLLIGAGGLLALPAYGYLDPASGSLVLQILLGGIAGAILAIRMYWKKIRSWFGRSVETQDSENPGADG